MNVKFILLGCLLLATLALSLPTTKKVESNLVKSLTAKNSANIIVKFQNGNKPAIRSAQRFRSQTRSQQINYLVSSLKALSESSQQNVLNLLETRSRAFRFTSQVTYHQIWATNELYVKGADTKLVDLLSSLPEVAEIREERIVYLEQLPVHQDIQVANETFEWGIEKIEAAQAWNMTGGNNGEGVILANIDTGVRATHEALKDNFRGKYGWFDGYSGVEVPIDEGGHGTHTMGTIAGSGGIGVAPGAKWMACRACGSRTCSESGLKSCGQWILCPTLANGESPDCTKAPQLVSNSWGGGQGDDWYNGIIEAWKAANIIPIFSNGNAGPSCGTANSPGDQDVIAVGATTVADDIWVSSSVGPSVAGVIKPDISAPGHQVRSAGHNSDSHFFVTSGTSMACPHVSGVVALLLSKNPNLSYAQVKQVLEQSADREILVDTGKTCGGIVSTQFPNNQYGHGRLNARKALSSVSSH